MTVVSTNPAHLQENVGRNQIFTITFSLPVATSSASKVSFSSPYGVVAGTSLAWGETITFTPSAPLPVSVPIVGRVDLGVKGMLGEPLESPLTWTFRTVNGPDSIAIGGEVHNADVAVSSAGLVMAVYALRETSGDRLFARHYLPESGWDAAYEIPVTNSPVNNVQVECTNGNEAVVVWSEGNPWPVTLRTAKFTLAGGWSNSEVLGTTSGWDQFKMNEQGLGYIAYFGSRYRNPDGTWPTSNVNLSPAFDIATNGVLFDGGVAANPATGSGNFFAQRYIPGSGWTSTVLTSGGFGATRTATFGDDDAVLAAPSNGVLRSWQFNGTSWSELPTLALNNWWYPEIKLNQQGNGCAVWLQSTRSTWNLFALARNAATGWDSITSLESSSAMAGIPSVAVTGDGTSLVVWNQGQDTSESIWMATYIAGAGWAVDILDEDDFNNWNPKVSAMGDVRAATWVRHTNSTTMEVMVTILD